MRVLRTVTTTAVAVLAAATVASAASAESILTGPTANVPPAVAEIHDRPSTTPAAVVIHDRPVVTPAAELPTSTPAVETAPSGIDWTDVLLGVGIGVAALLLIEGVVHVVRHPPTRHPPVPSH
jgi:hypothetical protein